MPPESGSHRTATRAGRPVDDYRSVSFTLVVFNAFLFYASGSAGPVLYNQGVEGLHWMYESQRPHLHHSIIFLASLRIG